MSIQIIKMAIGIIGTIILGVLLIRELLKPVIDNKLAVLTIGRGQNEVEISTSNSNGVKFNTGRGLGTKSKTNSELINDTTIEENNETELLNDQTELLQVNKELDIDGADLLIEINEPANNLYEVSKLNHSDEVYDYTELINN